MESVMIIRITRTCIENHGAATRIEWALEKLREYMKTQVTESTFSNFDIDAHIVMED